jgi:hypothetical protein
MKMNISQSLARLEGAVVDKPREMAGKPVNFCNSISNHKGGRNTTYSKNEIPIFDN